MLFPDVQMSLRVRSGQYGQNLFNTPTQICRASELKSAAIRKSYSVVCGFRGAGQNDKIQKLKS
jgi:hypothetical protein